MLDAIADAARTALGLDVPVDELTTGQMALRALFVYGAGLAIVRIAKKRFMGQHSAFDGVLAVILGSVLSRAINGTSAVFESIVACLILVGAHWLTGWGAYRSHTFGDLVKGGETELVHDGRVRQEAMRHHHISKHDLEEAMRLNGQTTDVEEVQTAWLERNGDISVIKRRGQPRVIDVPVAPGTQTIRIQLE